MTQPIRFKVEDSSSDRGPRYRRGDLLRDDRFRGGDLLRLGDVRLRRRRGEDLLRGMVLFDSQLKNISCVIPGFLHLQTCRVCDHAVVPTGGIEERMTSGFGPVKRSSLVCCCTVLLLDGAAAGHVLPTRARRMWHLLRVKFRMRAFMAWLCAYAAEDNAHFDESGAPQMTGRGARRARDAYVAGSL